MSSIVIFDPWSSVVVNRVTRYQQFVNTPDYLDRTDVLVNPDLSGVTGVPQTYWQVSGSTVQAMSSSDQTAMTNYLQAKTLRQKLYHVVSYNNKNNATQELWFDTSSATVPEQYDGTAEVVNYVYSNNNQTLLSQTTTDYFFDGSIYTVETSTYYTNNKNQLIEKKDKTSNGTVQGQSLNFGQSKKA